MVCFPHAAEHLCVVAALTEMLFCAHVADRAPHHWLGADATQSSVCARYKQHGHCAFRSL